MIQINIKVLSSSSSFCVSAAAAANAMMVDERWEKSKEESKLFKNVKRIKREFKILICSFAPNLSTRTYLREKLFFYYSFTSRRFVVSSSEKNPRG